MRKVEVPALQDKSHICVSLRKPRLGAPIGCAAPVRRCHARSRFFQSLRDAGCLLQGSTNDRVDGLRSGADDYLPKPFEFDELIARIEALHRRNSGHASPEPERGLTVGPLDFDVASMRLTLSGQELDLTSKERDLLVLLMKNVGRVCARERLLNSVWGLDSDPLTNVVDVTVSRVRRKLGDAADMIATIRNYGYRLDG